MFFPIYWRNQLNTYQKVLLIPFTSNTSIQYWPFNEVSNFALATNSLFMTKLTKQTISVIAHMSSPKRFDWSQPNYVTFSLAINLTAMIYNQTIYHIILIATPQFPDSTVTVKYLHYWTAVYKCSHFSSIIIHFTSTTQLHGQMNADLKHQLAKREWIHGNHKTLQDPISDTSYGRSRRWLSGSNYTMAVIRLNALDTTGWAMVNTLQSDCRRYPAKVSHYGSEAYCTVLPYMMQIVMTASATFSLSPPSPLYKLCKADATGAWMNVVCSTARIKIQDSIICP